MDSISQAARLRCLASSLTAAQSFCQEMLQDKQGYRI